MNRNSLNNPAQFINIMTPLSWIFVPGFSDEEVKKCWHFTLGKFKVPFINLNTLTTKRYQPSVKRLASWEPRTDSLYTAILFLPKSNCMVYMHVYFLIWNSLYQKITYQKIYVKNSVHFIHASGRFGLWRWVMTLSVIVRELYHWICIL